MAHGFLQSLDEKLIVRSAGTEASGKLNQNAVAVMKEVDIDISHHTSDSVDLYLEEEWDYVITVCGGAKFQKGHLKRGGLFGIVIQLIHPVFIRSGLSIRS